MQFNLRLYKLEAFVTLGSLLTYIVYVGYGAMAALARDYVISRAVVMTWTKRAFAGTFGFLGLKLALSD